jgi:ABC-type polysaccharide/polyol phosphate transport system ATPase subunit
VSGDLLVRLHDVSKRFKLYDGTWSRLLDWLHLPPRPRYREFWALRDVSCEVRRGECVGIIGPNGAGKSTLLKLLTGSLYPTSGQLEVHGTVLSLLELGTGFNPELSGRQNIEHSARLLGFPPGYALARVREIESFAELGDYFDQPVKLYSSGMLVRLAFSLFSTMQPEIFLVDEALAVGDLRFASKAFGRIRGMLDAGTTLLFVSHDLQLINHLCTRALWLQSGAIQMDGPPAEVTRAYQQFVVRGAAAAEPEATPAPSSAVDSEPQLSLGRGWYPLEAFRGEVFRWASPEAELLVASPAEDGDELLLDVEPVLSNGSSHAPLEITDAAGRVLANFELAGRGVVHVKVPDGEASPRRLYLRSAATTPELDGRPLGVRVLRWGWVDEAALRPIQQASDWVDPTEALELGRELVSMRAALRRCAPVAAAPARITCVVTRADGGAPAVRFASHAPLALDVTLEGVGDVERPVVGVQVRDAFDRMIWTTRTDWQQLHLPPLTPGGSLGVTFATDKLLLGRGLYQVTVAVHGWPRDDRVFHWIDGAWRFEVVESGAEEFKGVCDLGWQCAIRANG